MTDRQIQFALKKIQHCKEAGCNTEALIKQYFLNLALIRYMLKMASPATDTDSIKAKALLKQFIKEISLHPQLKAIIHKRSLKSILPWAEKMDVYFKQLKMGHDRPMTALLSESEKVFALLKVSANKVLVKSKK